VPWPHLLLPAAHTHCASDTNDINSVDTGLCTDVIATTAVLVAWVMSWPQVGGCSNVSSPGLQYTVVNSSNVLSDLIFVTADGVKVDTKVGCTVQ